MPTSPNQEAPALFTETNRHQSDIGKPSFFRNSICTQSDDVVRMQTPLPQGIHQRSGRFRPGQPHQRSERHARPVAEIWRTNSDRRRHQDHNCPDRPEQCPNRRRCPRAIQHRSRGTLPGDLPGSRMPWGIAGCRNAPPLPPSITFFNLLPVALRDRVGHIQTFYAPQDFASAKSFFFSGTTTLESSPKPAGSPHTCCLRLR